MKRKEESHFLSRLIFSTKKQQMHSRISLPMQTLSNLTHAYSRALNILYYYLGPWSYGFLIQCNHYISWNRKHINNERTLNFQVLTNSQLPDKPDNKIPCSKSFKSFIDLY